MFRCQTNRIVTHGHGFRRVPLELLAVVEKGSRCAASPVQPVQSKPLTKGLLRKRDSSKCHKTVRFTEKINEETFVEKRSEKIIPKKCQPSVPGDVPNPCPKYGEYLDDPHVRLEVMSNMSHNTSSKVNDFETKRTTKIVPNYQINQGKTEYYAETGSISYITTCILLGENEILELISQEIIIDCVLNMMEIYEHLETEDSMFTLDYKSGVSISNCEGKRQRGIIKEKIDFITCKYL